MKTLAEMIDTPDVGDLTLEEATVLHATAISGLQAELSDGGIWNPRASGGSCKTCAIVDRLLSCLAQAMGAHYRLRYWTAQNGYATTLPTRMILQNYTLGSMLLRELVDMLSLAIEYSEEWKWAKEEENNAAFEPADER